MKQGVGPGGAAELFGGGLPVDEGNDILGEIEERSQRIPLRLTCRRASCRAAAALLCDKAAMQEQSEKIVCHIAHRGGEVNNYELAERVKTPPIQAIPPRGQ